MVSLRSFLLITFVDKPANKIDRIPQIFNLQSSLSLYRRFGPIERRFV